MFLISPDCWTITSTTHKGRGIIAQRHIPEGTVIGDYLGRVIHIAEFDHDEDREGLYYMNFTHNAGIYPDMDKPGLYLINHACVPNCWMYTYRGHVLFFALRDIQPEEEITISYLLSPIEDCTDTCAHTCHCGDTDCIGTMHLSREKYQIWDNYHKSQRIETKPVKFAYGRHLPRLASYPSSIPYNPICSRITPRPIVQ